MSALDWLTACLAVYGAGMSTYAIRRQIKQDRRQDEPSVEVEIRQEIVSPRPVMSNGRETFYSKPKFELLVDVTNNGHAKAYVRELSIEAPATGGGYQEHSPNDASKMIERHETFTTKREIDPEDPMWAEGFNAVATLGSGEDFASEYYEIDVEMLDDYRAMKKKKRR